MKAFSTVIAVALVSGMVGAQSDKIIDAARFVVFGKSGNPAVVMTTDGVDAGTFAVYDNAGNEVFAVRGGQIINAELDKKLAELGAIGKERQFDQLTTKELKIVDAAGKPRIVAGVDHGAGALTISDARGKPRFVVGVLDTGAGFTVADADGKSRVLVGVPDSGGAGFALMDREGRNRVAISMDEPGNALMNISDINQPRVSMFYEKSGKTGFAVIGPAADIKIMAALSNNGEVILPTRDLSR